MHGLVSLPGNLNREKFFYAHTCTFVYSFGFSLSYFGVSERYLYPLRPRPFLAVVRILSLVTLAENEIMCRRRAAAPGLPLYLCKCVDGGKVDKMEWERPSEEGCSRTWPSFRRISNKVFHSLNGDIKRSANPAISNPTFEMIKCTVDH